MNHAANIAYAKQATNDGRIALPALFLHGAYDYTCETMTSRLAEPMRADCADLTEVIVPSGHWMTHEKPQHINAALARWLGTKFPNLWVG
jgi:pimeloyl-ACP methyl ester carboxylesterase